MKALVVSLPEDADLAKELARRLDAELGEVEIRSFPDDETYVRVDSPVEGRAVIVACTLNRPNQKFLPLIYLAETIRELGAQTIGLAAPYLSYLRQDASFRPGEGLTSRYFGRLISGAFDWLVTVDPHLHRYTNLDEVYSIPSVVVEAAESIAAWIKTEVERPVLVGPDEESYQWVSSVAAAGNFPSFILEKTRHGDYDVAISGRSTPTWSSQQPVIIDDIISTGRTMIEAVRHLSELDLKAPICLGVHGLFVGDAFQVLEEMGVAKIVTCNTVPHSTNAIDVLGPLAEAVAELLE